LIGGSSRWHPWGVPAAVCDHGSPHLLQQLPRFNQELPNPPSLGDRIPREATVLPRVLVCPWRAGSRCAAVHAAALPAAHRRRAARAAATGSGATTRARQHRSGISDVIAHAFASCLASAESRPELAALAALTWKSSKTLLEFFQAQRQRNRVVDGSRHSKSSCMHLRCGHHGVSLRRQCRSRAIGLCR